MRVVQGRLPGRGDAIHKVWEDAWMFFQTEKDMKDSLCKEHREFSTAFAS